MHIDKFFKFAAFLALLAGCSGYTNDASRLSATQRAQMQPAIEKDIRARCGTFALGGKTYLAPVPSTLAAAEGGLIRKDQVPLSVAAQEYWNNPGPQQPRLYAEYLVKLAAAKGSDPRILFEQIVRDQNVCFTRLFDNYRKEYERIRALDGEILESPLGRVSKKKLLQDTLTNLGTQARLTRLMAEFLDEAGRFLPATARTSASTETRTVSVGISPVAAGVDAPELAQISATAETSGARPVQSRTPASPRNTPALSSPSVEILNRSADSQDAIYRQKVADFTALYKDSCRFGSC